METIDILDSMYGKEAAMACSDVMESNNYNEIKHIANKFSAVLSPKKVILFGSYARGNSNVANDYDFL